MNKSAIKNYAIYARNKLRQSTIDMAASIGVHKDKIETPISQGADYAIFKNALGIEITLNKKEIGQRANLIKKINNSGFEQVIEEIAYTWFNRLIAIRFMEVNDYLPSRIRVLSSEIADKKETDLMISPFNCDLDFNEEEKNYIINLKDTNKQNELFKFLFIKQCNKLNEILPALFETTEDYSELLFNINYLDEEDVVYKLVNEIPESNFDVEEEGQVEIIGWMYQYYNTEPKAMVNARPKNEKLTKDDIPAVTQLFTPDWIVKYMVENSLGRIWTEGHPNEALKNNWKYYLEEAKQDEEVEQKLNEIRQTYSNLNPEDIKVIDPSMGSGHILIYAFDILMQIYEASGYSKRDAAELILKNNLFGLDIDNRAYQLSYFALMMKARQFNRRILEKNISPNVYTILESNQINVETFSLLKDYKPLALDIHNKFYNAKEYGSILKVQFDTNELNVLLGIINDLNNKIYDYHDLLIQQAIKELYEAFLPIVIQAKVMSTKYDVVITNPPYMAPTPMQKVFVENNYPYSKSDLCVVFMEVCAEMAKPKGYIAMINMHSWMFLSSFEKLRKSFVNVKTIINMAHLGARSFDEIGGEVVQTTAFIFSNYYIEDYIGSYKRLIDYNSQDSKMDAYLTNQHLYKTVASNFAKIPGSPIAYWGGNDLIKRYDKATFLSNVAESMVSGNKTANNKQFLRLVWEVSSNRIFEKYYPYTKGGEYRKWYGNVDYVIDWSDQAKKAYRNNSSACLINEQYWFKKGITFTDLTSKTFNCRILDELQLFDMSGPGILFKNTNEIFYIMGLFNSVVGNEYLSILSSSFHYKLNELNRVPILLENKKNDIVNDIVVGNIYLSKIDWDSFETSWDYLRHPLINSLFKLSIDNTLFEKFIESSYMKWETECTDRFNQLKKNEEELNRIFIDIYGLQDELTPEVADKDVTVRKANLSRDIKSFISYAVGCMFGRYSLDNEGLIYAGGEWDMSKYSSFIPDQDNIIPITDEEYFNDDIVGRFIEFVKVVYGAETLEDNLEFIAKALSNKGNTSREIIRSYFLNDFFKDHCQTYQVTGSGKRPIYWQFDSGKQNGFKAIMYMHRYNEDTVGKVRTEYLHKIQSAYEEGIKTDDYTIENSNNSVEIAKARKHKEKLIKQLEETKNYDQALAHKAAERIKIDLDDGVKHNYELFQGVEVVNEGSKMIKIDLLSPIK